MASRKLSRSRSDAWHGGLTGYGCKGETLKSMAGPGGSSCQGPAWDEQGKAREGSIFPLFFFVSELLSLHCPCVFVCVCVYGLSGS